LERDAGRRYAVVPAKAGTHNHRPLLLRKVDRHFSKRPPRRMGPCFRRDDGDHTLAAAGIV